MLEDHYDVIVVGARVAGSTVAALVGDAGYRVLLVDRATFPSPTLSTHFFRGQYMGSVLKRLGVLEEVLATGAPPLTCEYRYMDGAEIATITPPQLPGDIGYSLSIRREPLDHILVRRACQSPSVQLLEKTSVTDLLWEDDRVTGVRLKLDDGSEKQVTARLVIGADGRDSFVARTVQPETEVAVDGFRAMYYQYLRDYDYASSNGGHPDGPEFSMMDGEIAYVFPSDDAVVCVAISITLDSYKTVKQNYAENFRKHLSRHPGFGQRFLAATPDSQIFGYGPRQNYMRVPVGNGWALVGDAAQCQDPWSGIGMDMASTHATHLAEAILAIFEGKESETDALKSYHERRNTTGLPLWKETVKIAEGL